MRPVTGGGELVGWPVLIADGAQESPQTGVSDRGTVAVQARWVGTAVLRRGPNLHPGWPAVVYDAAGKLLCDGQPSRGEVGVS